jgi:hypothetical protein
MNYNLNNILYLQHAGHKTKGEFELHTRTTVLVGEMNKSSINGGNPYKKAMNIGLHGINGIRPIAHVFLSKYNL